jgi:hypothetical protein
MTKALAGCPCVGQNESKKEQKQEINRNLSIANISTIFYFF